MPPIRKPDLDKLKSPPKPYLSQSLGASSFRTSFDESTKVNLSASCFSAIRTEKGDPDDDLTSLNWLQNNDILKGFEVSATVPPMSPTRDVNGDLFETPPRGGQAKGTFSPDSLVNKRKSPSKPPYSFSSLIFMAIEEAPMKRLPVKDIYSWIMEHFPYFRDARLGWKNSVRHNLSLNKCFKKVDKDKGQVSQERERIQILCTVQCSSKKCPHLADRRDFFRNGHFRISSTNSRVRTTLYSIINSTIEKYCSVGFI